MMKHSTVRVNPGLMLSLPTPWLYPARLKSVPRKVRVMLKPLFLKFEKNFLCKRKDHLWSSFAFRNKFYA